MSDRLSDDIVDRLRNWAAMPHADGVPILIGAADEIVRLRSIVMPDRPCLLCGHYQREHYGSYTGICASPDCQCETWVNPEPPPVQHPL